MILSIFLAAVLPRALADCHDLDVPTLGRGDDDTGGRKVKVCCPEHAAKGDRFPVIAYQHGNVAGGWLLWMYDGLLEKIAEPGFCAIAPYSCAMDGDCDDGNSSYLEVLKALKFLTTFQATDKYPFNTTAPFTVAGHSTGGRAVLQIAALASPGSDYMKGMKEAEMLTDDLRSVLPRIKAVIADHPDEMYLEKNNPDIDRYEITDMPTLVWTGDSDDVFENLNSSWYNFQMITAPEKAFVDVHDQGHLEPTSAGDEGHAIAWWAQAYALMNDTAARLFFPKSPGTPQVVTATEHGFAKPGRQNTAEATAGYVSCSERYSTEVVMMGGTDYPELGTRFCKPVQRDQWKKWPQ